MSDTRTLAGSGDRLSVLVITHGYPSRDGPSNQVFVKKQVEKLAEFGVDVAVLATYAKRVFPFSLAHSLSLVPLWSTEPFNDSPLVHVRRMYVPILPKKAMSWYYGELLGPLVDSYARWHLGPARYHLIHAHMADYGGFIARWLSRRWKLPYVVTDHGGDTDVVVERSVRYRRAVRRCFLDARRVICVSQKVQKSVVKLGVPWERAPIVPNGINVEEVVTSPGFLKRRFPDRSIILSVSHLWETKGLQYNLQALRRLIDDGQDAQYVIVGAGPYEGRLRELTAALGLANRVSFEGAKDNREVMRYMSACDFFSMPSWQESFGIVYIEAMLNRKPAIGVSTEGISDVIVDGDNGFLIPPHDVDALVRCFKILIANPGCAEAMGRRAAAYVRDNLTWRQSALHLKAIYEHLVVARSQP